jgi:hypothetical protein
MEFGTLAHEAVLEPDNWTALCRPASKVDGRTTEGKAVKQWQQQQSEKFGYRFINEDLYNQIEQLAASVRTHLGASSLLASGVAEVSGILERFCDVNVRIRPDYLTDGHIIDLKTTVDGRSDAFSRSVMTFGYHIQAAFYVDVAQALDGNKRDFYWVAVEKEAPFAVAVYKASDAMLEYGRTQYKRAIELYKECASLDLWPAYSQQIQQLELPNWVKE